MWMVGRRTVAAVGTGLLLALVAACSASDDQGRSSSPDEAGPAGGGVTFEDYGVNPEVATAEDNQSTFALDVDTGSYAVTRSYLRDGYLPDPASVRTEEFVNYFPQDYAPPPDGIGIHLDGVAVPFLAGPGKRVIRVGLQAAVAEEAGRPPANLTFVVDASGSMAGASMEMVQTGLDQLVGSLRPDDQVAIVSYGDEAALRLPMTPLSEPAAIRQAIAGLEPGGSTNLEAGLRIGYEQAAAHLREGGINRVILLSDGEANVGQTDPAVLADQIAQAAGDRTQLVVVGVGRETYNEVVLEQFADRGNGFYAYIDTTREAERLFVHDLTGTIQVVALDAKVQVTFDPATVSHYRLLGYENRQLDDDDLRDDTVDGGEIGAGHTVTALYEVTVSEGTATHEVALATVDVRWRDPDSGEPVEQSAMLRSADLVGSLEAAAPRLRRDILVAAFAESLRGAPWGELVSLAQVADNARVLTTALPGDEPTAEFVELASIAAELSE